MKKWISALSILALLFTTGCREEVPTTITAVPENADADANTEETEHAEPQGEEAHDGDDGDGHDHDG